MGHPRKSKSNHESPVSNSSHQQRAQDGVDGLLTSCQHKVPELTTPTGSLATSTHNRGVTGGQCARGAPSTDHPMAFGHSGPASEYWGPSAVCTQGTVVQGTPGPLQVQPDLRGGAFPHERVANADECTLWSVVTQKHADYLAL